METLGLIIPTYGHFPYALRTIQSAYRHTRLPLQVFVIDDASPDWDAGLALLQSQLPVDVLYHHFPTNGGLTRSWNYGLQLAEDYHCTYACCGNSDLVFTPRWDEPLCAVLRKQKVHLVGPVTNAPGSCPEQNVCNFLPDYVVDDTESALQTTAATLAARYGEEVVVHTINGFCLLAKTETWWEHAYDTKHCFCPSNDYDSKGRKNPTPLMTLNEYELQRRWHKRGLRSGFCPGSFVFHYRSVSRGDRYKTEGWFRMS